MLAISSRQLYRDIASEQLFQIGTIEGDTIYLHYQDEQGKPAILKMDKNDFLQLVSEGYFRKESDGSEPNNWDI